jgi:hypothetical protein
MKSAPRYGLDRVTGSNTTRGKRHVDDRRGSNERQEWREALRCGAVAHQDVWVVDGVGVLTGNRGDVSVVRG